MYCDDQIRSLGVSYIFRRMRSRIQSAPLTKEFENMSSSDSRKVYRKALSCILTTTSLLHV